MGLKVLEEHWPEEEGHSKCGEQHAKGCKTQGLNMGLEVYRSSPLQGLALGPICRIELWVPGDSLLGGMLGILGSSLPGVTEPLHPARNGGGE